VFSVRRVLLLAFWEALALPSVAQIAGDLKGRVADATDAGVAKARVTVTQESTNIERQGSSQADGQYDFPGLQPGVYRVEVQAEGFAPAVRESVQVNTGATAELDLVLGATGGRQAVTVSADAPLLQAATSDIETTIPGATVLALPLNGRNFVQLTTLAPGVSLPPGTLLPRINGGRPRTNEYLFDGISALQPEPGQVAFFPIIDDIQEFTVEANNVPAEFGRFNGGVVNLSTRSGSNTVHGSLYEFLRNEDLNARNYFAGSGVGAGARKPLYRRNQYGATLGAPVLRDRLFFFGGYQGQRQAIGVTRISTVPTVAQRAGNFAGVAHVFDPASTRVVNGKYVRSEFANDRIASGFDPAALALLSRFPLPTSSGAANNYSRTANDSDHVNQIDARVDGAYGTHDRAFGRYSYFGDVEQPVTPLPDGNGVITGAVVGTGGVSGLSHVLAQQAVFNETHTFTGDLLNDVRVGYTRRANTIQGATLSNTASAALGIPGIPTNTAFANALPLFTLTGLQQLGPSGSTFSQYQTGVWQVVETVFFERGRHQIKAGADLRWYQLNAIAPPNPTGSFAFTTTGTNQQGYTAADKLPNGSALASFLLGQVDTFSIDLQGAKIRPRDAIQEFFVQDDWRAMPNLTLNLGVRYTLHHPSTERSNQGAVFNLATQQLQYLGVGGLSRSARKLHYGNFAPRLGFAYRVTPQTVVRGSFGIVFIDQSGITTPFTTPQFPFIQNVTQPTLDSVNAAFQLSKGPSVAPIALNANAGLGQSVYTANRQLGSGYVEQWNGAVQRELRPNTSFEIAYVGSHIVHVGIPDANLNQLTAGQLAQGASLQTAVANPYYGVVPVSSTLGRKTISQAQLLKPYPRFQNVAYYRNNTGTSNYNALEAKLEQRISRGLSLLVSYTHSKLMDDASSVFSSTVLSSPNTSSIVAADTFRPYLEHDASTGDVPNVTALSATYLLPAAQGHRFAAGAVTSRLLGGWAVNGIASLQSGMPVAVTQATNLNAFAGFSLQRPNIVGGTALPSNQRTTAKWFNTGAFAGAPQFALGNASRNPVRGPAYRDLDLALVKHTVLAERTELEFRAEMFDVTNTPSFAQPNGSFGAAAFGSVTATATDPRVVQFALRLSR